MDNTYDELSEEDIFLLKSRIKSLESYNEINRTIDVALGLETLYSIANSIENPTKNTNSLIRIATVLAVSGTPNDPVYLSTALESDDEDTTGQDHGFGYHGNTPIDVGKKTFNLGKKLFAPIKGITLALAAGLTVSYKAFKKIATVNERYATKLKKLKEKFAKIKEDTKANKVSIRISNGKYFYYKENVVVPSGEEFFKQYKETSKHVNGFNDKVLDYLASNSISAQHLNHIVTAVGSNSYYKNFRNTYDMFADDLFKDLYTSEEFKVTKKEEGVTAYYSESLLGCGKIRVSTPIKGEVDPEDVDSVKENLHKFSIKNMPNISEGTNNKASIYFKDTTISHIDDLIRMCEDNLSAFDTFNDSYSKNIVSLNRMISGFRDITTGLTSKVAGGMLGSFKLISKIADSLNAIAHIAWHRSQGLTKVGLDVLSELVGTRQWRA